MIGNITTLLNQVYNLNTSTNSKNTSSKGDKTERSDSFDVQDIVEISSRKPGKHSDKKSIHMDNVLRKSLSEKTDINSAGEINEGTGLSGQYKIDKSNSPAKTSASLTEEEKKMVEKLKARDREVRQHEQAHLAAAGQYAKGVTFKSQIGPDGSSYAIGGEVDIDMSEIPGNPDATIAKAQAIRRAASAPSHPSSQDRLVAAAATRMEAKVRMEKMKGAEAKEGGKGTANGVNANAAHSSGIDKADNSGQNEYKTSDMLSSAYEMKSTEAGKLFNKAV
jgi:hypothetical protein